ncbi:MAG: hypothetical protein R2874_07415 [Desulfobacterales bacterium]
MEETTANEFRKKLKHYADKSILNHEVLRVKEETGRILSSWGKRLESN